MLCILLNLHPLTNYCIVEVIFFFFSLFYFVYNFLVKFTKWLYSEGYILVLVKKNY